jgi:hypothetical protein
MSWRARVVAAAAAIVALVTVALLVAQNGGEVEVGPAGVPDDGGRTSTTSPTTTSLPPTSGVPPSPSPPTGPPGSDAAVLAFLDALGNGDFAGAAARIGLQSEARITEAGRPVEDVLREAQEGYGAWVSADDRTTRIVELRPGQAVVVVSGTIAVEGTVEQRDDAFPVRHAESADAWLVEPWAYEQQAGRPMLVTPAPARGEPQPVERIDRVEAETPGEGIAWLSIDGGVPREATVGPDHTATWRLFEPLRAGRHTLMVAFENETSFAASASSYVVEP